MSLKPFHADLICYLKSFREPVSVQHLADAFSCGKDHIRKQMRPLTAAGLVKLHKLYKTRPGFVKPAWSFYYEVVDKRPYMVGEMKYHDPFNLVAA